MKTTTTTLLIALAPAAFLSRPAAAAGEAPKPVAIVGGDVQTVTQGLIRKGTVLLKDGKIERVGLGIEVPKDYTVVDASGKYVMPGFVVASARGIGVSGFGGGRGRGGRGGGGPTRGKLSDGFDPYAFTVSLALASGITTAFLNPGGGGFGGFFEDPVGGRSAGISGLATVMKPTEGDLASMTLKEPAAILVDYAASSPAGKFEVREKLKGAREYLDKRESYEKDKLAGKDVKEPPKDDEKEMLARLLEGEISARVTATEVDDILAVIDLAREFGIKVVLEAATEAWIVADEIGKSGIACVITPRRKQSPNRFKAGPSGSSDELSAILARSGVRIAVVPPTTTLGTGGIAGRDLVTFPLEAAFAMRGGLDERGALASITIGAAEILGVADRVGSLEAGKDADVIVLDGHPLDYRTFVEKTFINGKLYYDKSESTFFSHLERRQ